MCPLPGPRSKNPRALNGVNMNVLNIDYFDNAKAWMRGPLFVEVVKRFNLYLAGLQRI